MAYLALTRVFFGYVIAASVALLAFGLIWRRTKLLPRPMGIFLLALAWCTPYLLYTYAVTGKVFYWSTAGGVQLYWLTTPKANELGSWFSETQVKDSPELAPHRKFYATLEGLSDVQKDEMFKSQALFNIAHHPTKYLFNCMANIGRLLFSYPYSFELQNVNALVYLVPNMFLVVLCVLSIVPALLRARAIPFELWAVLAFALISFSGLTLLSAYGRFFWPLVPPLGMWVAFVYARVLRIELPRSTDSAAAYEDTGGAHGAHGSLAGTTS